MEALKVLEQHVISLIALIRDLKKANSSLENKVHKLQTQNDDWQAKNKDLKAEIAHLSEENTQLVTKLGSLEGSLQQGKQTVHKLSEEQQSTKVVIDDLIKSINDIVAEKQR